MRKPNKIVGQLRGCLALLILILSTTLFFIPILLMGLLKLFPQFSWRVFCTKIIDKVIACWSDVNNAYINSTQRIQWQINMMHDLQADDWYLVIANHQSWLDIVLLQHLFNRKIPVLKFFIKDVLKWVPLLGFSWWAMGSPFMKRYSKEYLAKNPHKKGQDLLSTRKALSLFKKVPSSIMNFVEGTRFTDSKKAQQQSPYKHLLKPKAGGISFVISTMSDQIDHLIDVTIAYPNKHYSLWDFLCHRMDAIAIQVRRLPIPQNFLNPSLVHDEQLQSAFRTWLNEQWEEKDRLITQLQNRFRYPSLDERLTDNIADTTGQSELYLPRNQPQVDS